MFGPISERDSSEISNKINLKTNIKKSAKRLRVNFRSAWRPAGMSRHNHQRSVEEGRSLLGGTHAIKSVKASVDKCLSTGVNKNVSAPHLIHKWFTGHSRPRSCSVTFMLFFLRPTL
jgi:hypothetical protein